MAKSKRQIEIEKQYNDFIEKYKPVTNHLNKGAGYNGLMFDLSREEIDFVFSQPNNQICTVIDGEGSDLVLIAGYWRADRLGYFVLSVPMTDEEMKNFEIVI